MTYLETLGGLEKGAEGLLRHVYLTAIHKFEQGRHIVSARSVQYDNQPRWRGRHALE